MLDSKVKRDKHRNASDIPVGDTDSHRATRRVNYTTSRHHHKPVLFSLYRVKFVSYMSRYHFANTSAVYNGICCTNTLRGAATNFSKRPILFLRTPFYFFSTFFKSWRGGPGM